jgi:hypothetical protein
VHDAISFEKAGMPAAAICTEPFIPSGNAIAKIRGIEGYPFAVIPHPVGSLEEEGVALQARRALPQVLELLLTK